MSEHKMDARLLDRIAAQRGQKIVSDAYDGTNAKEIENLVTKVLGVFQENGVYAGFLFLLSRTREKEKAIACVIREQLLDLAAEGLDLDREGYAELARDPDKILTYVRNTICSDLDRLLLAKQVFERALIYARYGAKALNTQKEG